MFQQTDNTLKWSYQPLIKGAMHRLQGKSYKLILQLYRPMICGSNDFM